MKDLSNLSRRIDDLSPAIIDRATDLATADLGPIVFRELDEDDQDEYLYLAYEEFMTILRGVTNR